MGSLIIILIVYIIYFIFSVSKYEKDGHFKQKKNGKKKLTKKEIEELKKLDYDKLPAEAKYFVSKYRVDMDKINLRGLLKMIGLILGFNIAIATIIVITVIRDKPTLQIVVGFVIVLVLFLISLKILSKYLEKKGVMKDE